MLIPVKHSVAVMIFNGDKVLSVRRPDDDDELPGVWGLPAGTLRPSETIKDLIGRIGRDKLGVELTPVRKVASGRQMRRLYLWRWSFGKRLWLEVQVIRTGDGRPSTPWGRVRKLGLFAAPWRYKPKAASANHGFA